MASTYDAAAIEVLSGLDPVRKRPGMYTDTTRPNHLAQEVIDNSVDEAITGHASRIDVKLFKDGSLEVRDDGRGIQIAKLKDIARNTGEWDEDEIYNWDDHKTIEIIFRQGVSTSENPDLIAGRGVGMNIIQEKLNLNNGTLSVNFKKGKFCEFIIDLPFDN